MDIVEFMIAIVSRCVVYDYLYLSSHFKSFQTSSQMREFNTGSFPKGLSLMLGSMKEWIYDRSPTEGLKFEEPLAALKESIAKDGSKVFSDMVREFILENTHRTTIEMYPSKTLEAEQIKVSLFEE